METKTTPAELIDDEHKRDTRGRRIAEPHRRAESIAGYASGGLTQKAYARREGVNDHTLVAWLGQSRRVTAVCQDRRWRRKPTHLVLPS